MIQKLILVILFVFSSVVIAIFAMNCNFVVSNSVSKEKSIHIYRYGNFSQFTAQHLENDLRVYFPNVVLEKEAIPLPTEYYNKKINRYSATGLLKDIKKYKKGDIVIGLTDFVIYKANEISPTYGIMGVGSVNGGTCIVSSKIPKNHSTQKPENFTKLALHELGHAFGLPHCPDQHCYMVDAEHKMKLPQSRYFCGNCREILESKGWTLK